MRTAVVGGGAAGFFLAISLKEMVPQMAVTIFEKSQKVLEKVKVSGGGRCNCTNTFAAVNDLSKVYPRGHRLMKRLFNVFNQHDACQWFERRGVRLVTQADQCVFPASQDSHTIINCLTSEARRLGIEVLTGSKVTSLQQLQDYDFVAVTTGGSPRAEGLSWLTERGIETVAPVPSLFSISIDDKRLQSLMGTVDESAILFIPSTKLRATGPLLITHWGISGPATLRLSSYAARELHAANYKLPLAINWVSSSDTAIARELYSIAAEYPQKLIQSIGLSPLSSRLWAYLTEKALGRQRALGRWKSLNMKEMYRLTNILCNDTYHTAGRTAFKEEFVTCGGVSLKAVNPNTLESRVIPRLFFAGEVLDIDGVTGGFNFQAAWTTAYTVALAIAAKSG